MDKILHTQDYIHYMWLGSGDFRIWVRTLKMIRCRRKNIQMFNPMPFKSPSLISIIYTACILTIIIDFIPYNKTVIYLSSLQKCCKDIYLFHMYFLLPSWKAFVKQPLPQKNLVSEHEVHKSKRDWSNPHFITCYICKLEWLNLFAWVSSSIKQGWLYLSHNVL